MSAPPPPLSDKEQERDRLTDRQTDRQTDNQSHRQTERMGGKRLVKGVMVSAGPRGLINFTAGYSRAASLIQDDMNVRGLSTRIIGTYVI